MKNIVVVKKGGEVETLRVKDFSFETLYKKCKFRSKNNFDKQHTWEHKDGFISLFARACGRAGSENKYDLPPPVDTKLFFGTLALVYHANEETDDDEVLDLEKQEWEACYNKLFGGFEDLGDEEEEEEEETIPEEYQTQQGYSKEDGFIVDDNAPLLAASDDDESVEEWKEGEEETDSNLSDEEDEDEAAVYGHETTDEESDGEDDEEEENESDPEEEADDSELDEEGYSYK
jgi:hypothetical protein